MYSTGRRVQVEYDGEQKEGVVMGVETENPRDLAVLVYDVNEVGDSRLTAYRPEDVAPAPTP